VREHDLATRRPAQLDHVAGDRVGDQMDLVVELMGELLEARDADLFRGAIDL
jgi:hypothetical protein